MKMPLLIGCLGLSLLGSVARAEVCPISIEANDTMQFNTQQISVRADCSEVELTLKHSGKLAARVMGHDWVLARTADVPGVLNAAMAAGAARGFLPEHDDRIIAATRIVGGGESAVARFSLSAIKQNESYTFFCSTPGHATVMRGTLLIGRD